MGYTDAQIKEKLKISSKTLNELKILNATASRIKSLDKAVHPDIDEMDPQDDLALPTRPSAESEVLSQEFFAFLESQVSYLKTQDKHLGEFLEYYLGVNGKYRLDRDELCATLNISKKEYESLRRNGNKYLRIQLISSGWYETSKSSLKEIVTCYTNDVKKQ